MEFRRHFVAVFTLAASVLSGTALADAPSGLRALPSFASLELEAVHGSSNATPLLNGPSNAALLERMPGRDAMALSLRYFATPWLSFDFAGGLLRADDDGNPLYLGTRVFDQAGATLHGTRYWNASLFVNYFRMDSAALGDGVQASNASFVNGRINFTLTRRLKVSVDALNLFDKRVSGIDRLASPRLWTEPLIAENVVFDAAEARAFRIRLGYRF